MRETKIKKIVFNEENSSCKMDVGEKNIISMTLTEVLNSSDGISMGATCSNKLVAEILVPAGLVFASATLVPKIERDGNDVPLGKFYVYDVTTNNEYKTITLECYDDFCKTEKEYTPPSEAKSADEILKDIAKQCGFKVKEDDLGQYENYKITPDSGYTCRQMIGYIAGLKGKNAHFDRNGELTFKWYENKDIVITKSEIYQNQIYLYKEDKFTINSPTSGTEDNILVNGEGMGISFENPFINQCILDGLLPLDDQNKFSYYPCEVKYRGNLEIEVGDIVCVEDKNGNTFPICVMEQVTVFNGGMQSEIFSYAKNNDEYSFEAKSSSSIVAKLTRRLNNAVMMTKDIKNANGGVFEIVDSDGDGINDSFVLRLQKDSGENNYIVGNANGIGFSSDGGETFRTAINQNGICTEAIDVDNLWAAFLGVEGAKTGDVFTISEEDGKGIVLTIGSNGDIMLKQKSDEIGFYSKKEYDAKETSNGDDGNDNYGESKSEPQALCKLTPDSLEIQKECKVSLGMLKIKTGTNDIIIFDTGGSK